MGLLEIHFHDSELVFRPSMRIGPSLPEASSSDAEVDDAGTVTTDTGDTLRFPLDEPEGGRKRGLVAAFLLIGVILLAKKLLENRGSP